MARQLMKEDFKQAFQSTTAQTQNLVLKAAKGKDNPDFPKLFAEYKWENAKPYDMALIIIAYYTYCMKSSNPSIKKFGFTARNTNHYSFKLLNNLIKGNGAKVKALMQPYFQIPMNKILESVIPGTDKQNILKRSQIIANFVKQTTKIKPWTTIQHNFLISLINKIRGNLSIADRYEELTQVEQDFAPEKKEEAKNAVNDLNIKKLPQILRKNIIFGDLKSVQKIIKSNPEILKLPLEDNGCTALHVAIEYGSTDVVRLLLQQPSIDPNIKDNNGFFPLWLAASHYNGDNNSAEITKLLLDHPKIDPNIQDSMSGRTALNEAARCANVNVMQLLLPRVNNPNIPDHDGNTPLHNAFNRRNTRNERHHTINQLFLQAGGINPNIQNHNGDTALHLAADFGDQNIIERLLLDYHGNPNIRNNDGNTALHLAARCGNQNIIDLLIVHGADPDIPNNRFQTYQNLLPQPPRHIG